MKKKNVRKFLVTLLLNILIYMLCVRWFGLTLFTGSILQKLGGWVLLAICGYDVFGSLKKNLLPPKKTIQKANKPQTVRDLKKTVQNTQPKAFKKEMRTLRSQTERMADKKETLDKSLKDYFGDSRMSYEKFMTTIDSVERLFIENTQRIVNRINLFDEEGYRSLFERHLEYTSAIVPYNESFTYVSQKLEENEQILQKMDRLMLEVANLNESQTPIDQLPAMQEISELIEQTKLYRQN